MTQPAWAKRYSTETLYDALRAGTDALRDVSVLFDVSKQTALQANVTVIQEELNRREAESEKEVT